MNRILIANRDKVAMHTRQNPQLRRGGHSAQGRFHHNEALMSEFGLAEKKITKDT